MEIERERGVIVAGRGVDDPAAVAALSAATGWPVLADPRSGCRIAPTGAGRGAVAAFDAILRHEGFAAAHVPEVVVHLGEPPASKVLATWLAESGATQVRVHPTDAVIDPAHVDHASGGRRRWASAAGVWPASSTAGAGPTGSIGGCSPNSRPRRRSPRRSMAVDELSRTDGRPTDERRRRRRRRGVVDAGARRRVVRRATPAGRRRRRTVAPTASTARSPLPSASPPPARLRCTCWWATSPCCTTRRRSRRSRHRGLDVRIVVVDNDGGGIFSFLPQAGQLPAERFERLFGTPHGTDVVALAAAHGLPAGTAGSVDELRGWLQRPGPWLVRVATRSTSERRRTRRPSRVGRRGDPAGLAGALHAERLGEQLLELG